MSYTVLEKEIEKLDEMQRNAVVLFIRFLVAQNGGNFEEDVNQDIFRNTASVKTSKMRKLGGFEEGFYIAPDFDEPLEEFAEYM